MEAESSSLCLLTGGEHGNDAQRESASTEVTQLHISPSVSFSLNQLLFTIPLFPSPSPSSLIPVPPVSQWHDHASVVSASTPAFIPPGVFFLITLISLYSEPLRLMGTVVLDL